MLNRSYLILEKELVKLKNPAKAKTYSRFFKTGKGEYGEGTLFLGLTIPKIRAICKNFSSLPLSEIKLLLTGKYHEYCLAGSFILNKIYEKANLEGKNKIIDFYLTNAKLFNNWDLVDGSAPYILGDWLINNDRSILYKLVKSENLWERRISIMATFGLIKVNQFTDTFKISEILLADKHDLIHKAVGWMLREIGKRDIKAEENFLEKYAKKMPRTMLRYAVEKFPKEKRDHFLNLK